ncbi:MAG: hypothetical protein M1587_04085 [Thaumarchaeota archaeon]|nr:hypothetical protein [Nitrososphaerota archaeon]
MDNMFALVKEIFDLQVSGDLEHPKTGHLVYGDSQPTELPRPKVLVQLVGFSIEPLLLSALALRPEERLILLFSKETEKDRKNPLKDLLRKNGLKAHIDDNIVRDGKNVCMVGSSNPGDIFKAISEAVGEYKSSEVAVDITGGKKSMVSTAFLAAVIFDYSIYYVDHEEYMGTTPFPGTEFLSKLPSPIGMSELYDRLKKKFGNINKASQELTRVFLGDMPTL